MKGRDEQVRMCGIFWIKKKAFKKKEKPEILRSWKMKDPHPSFEKKIITNKIENNWIEADDCNLSYIYLSVLISPIIL